MCAMSTSVMIFACNLRINESIQSVIHLLIVPHVPAKQVRSLALHQAGWSLHVNKSLVMR